MKQGSYIQAWQVIGFPVFRNSKNSFSWKLTDSYISKVNYFMLHIESHIEIVLYNYCRGSMEARFHFRVKNKTFAKVFKIRNKATLQEIFELQTMWNYSVVPLYSRSRTSGLFRVFWILYLAENEAESSFHLLSDL